MTDNLIFKQYDYMKNVEPNEFYIPPFDYNYNILGLSKKRGFNQGELNRIDYYGWVDTGGTFQDLILSEYRTFYRKDRLVYKRELHIDWYLSDDTIGADKTTYKFYTPEESLKLGERRRRNIISDMKINTIGLISMISGVTSMDATMIGLVFLAELTSEVTNYVEGIEDQLKTKLMTISGYPWLDAEIPNTGGVKVREYLYSNVNIDYTDKLG